MIGHNKTSARSTQAVVAVALLLAAAVSRAEPSEMAGGEAPGGEAALARVLDEPLAAADLIAAETEFNRERMTPKEFAEWREYSHNKLLVMAVRGPLLAAYAQREGLEPTSEEIAPFAAKLSQPNRIAGQPAPAEPSAAVLRASEDFARRAIRGMKVGEALWRKHGGTCGFGTLGSCTPFEAEMTFFRGEVEASRLEFLDPDTEARFWEAIADKQQLADVVHEEPEAIEETFRAVRSSWSGE